MSQINYNERKWINDEDSHYTGSIVCFDGENVINQGKLLDRYSFVEVSSCHAKVRIHRDNNLPVDAFIEKLRILESELSDYIAHLEKVRDFDSTNLKVVKRG